MKLKLAILLLTLALLPASLLGQSELTVLGFDGKPIRVIQSTYGDLFPLGTEADPRSPVLVLELARGDRSVDYLLVPGTEGADRESATSLVFDKTSDALYVFWESLQNAAAELRLTRLGADLDWSEVLTISGNPLSPGSHPSLSVTQDTAHFEGPEGETVTQHRTLLHLVWSELGPQGDRVMYTPVVLENGSFGASSSFDLSTLAEEPANTSTEPMLSLVTAPTVSRGRNERTVILAFADPRSRALMTAEIHALPQELQRLAAGGRANITIVGHRMPRPRMADVMHGYVVDSHVSSSFHPAAVDYIAGRVRDTVLSFGDPGTEPDLEQLGERIWEEILRSGASFGSQGLVGSAPEESTLLAMEGQSTAAPEEHPEEHVLEVRPVAVFPAPQTGDAPTRIFVSPDGRNVLVGWLGERELLYREWKSEGWSAVQSLPLGEGRTLPQAYELLERRVR